MTRPAAATIPLDEIVPGATVRVVVMDGVQYLSIRDLIMCVCVTGLTKGPLRFGTEWPKTRKTNFPHFVEASNSLAVGNPSNPL